MSRFPSFFCAARNGLVLFYVLFLCVQPVSGTLPPWLKPGKWVEYKSRLYSLSFLNGTKVSSDSGFKTVLRIECLTVKVDTAEMNVTLEAMTQNIYLSAKVYVDADRNVTLPGGKYVGKTFLWLPRNPKQGENLTLTDSETANAHVGGYTATCQGYQKCFLVDTLKTYWIDGLYDLDTGILVDGTFLKGSYTAEATMLALNISRVLSDSLELADTNIDLGPREWLYEIIDLIPLFLPLMAFMLILIYMLHRRRRRRKKMSTHAHPKNPEARARCQVPLHDFGGSA